MNDAGRRGARTLSPLGLDTFPSAEPELSLALLLSLTLPVYSVYGGCGGGGGDTFSRVDNFPEKESIESVSAKNPAHVGLLMFTNM